MPYESIREIRDCLDELMRMHQLNMELLDTLGTILDHLREYQIKNNLPNFDDATLSLLHRATTLYDELTSTSVPQGFLVDERQRKASFQSRRVFTGKKNRRRFHSTLIRVL